MTRPSGTCEGQPCYTAQDIIDINFDLAVWEAKRDSDQAALDQSTQKVQQYQMELEQAEMNQCP